MLDASAITNHQTNSHNQDVYITKNKLSFYNDSNTTSQKWFNTLESIINNFYWKDKKPRIALKTLQKPKEQGELSAPNFQYYYLAVQLHSFDQMDQ